MRKRTFIILLSVFAALLLLAIPLHLQKGLTWNDAFWKQTGDTTFSANSKNAFQYTKTDAGIVFDITLNGESMQLMMTETGENLYRFDGDGWAMEIADGPFFSVSMGGITYSMSEAALIVTNAVSPIYQFAPCHYEASSFYGDYGEKLGEHFDLITDSSYYLYSYETWYDHPEMSMQPAEPIPFEEGLHLKDGNLYVNAQGEYLTNTRQLMMVQTDQNNYTSKESLLHFLLNATQRPATRRGHFISFVYGIALYLLGLATLRWPQQMAFFSSRWQFRHEPELSDAGLFSMLLSGAVIMVAGIVFLYLPLFILP